jgi:Coenzyme PQQ synthesis protein D (PqqD)
MNSSSHFRINTPAVVSEIFDDEMVIINLDNGNYYSTNKVAADIWAFIDRAAVVSKIIEGIGHRYSENFEDIESAVTRFIAELQEEKLIVPIEMDQAGKIDRPDSSAETGTEREELIFEEPVLKVYNDMQELLLLDPVHEVDETGWPSTKSDA